MRNLELVVLEMESQAKQLHGLLRVGRLNTLTEEEFQRIVALVGRLGVNLTDFNVLHFGPKLPTVSQSAESAKRLRR